MNVIRPWGGTMTSKIDLADRRVLVTGASGGLGRAIAATLVRSGAHVALTDRPGSDVEDAAAALASGGRTVVGWESDLTMQASSVPGTAAAALGGLDGLVNAAGIMHTTPFAEVTHAEWQQTLTVNLTATFQTVQAAAAAMADGGSMVNLASVAARSARPHAAHYAASKSGVLSLTKSAAVAFGPRIRVNAVCPGLFLTPMWDTIFTDRDATFGPGAGARYFDEIRQATPLGRDGQPEELANVVAFLLSDLAGYITGQALNVCGGLEMD
ncbi:SDR family NAD(P)-dependent oxidoreductase [Streptomyces tubercidicus]|uniref:SDR family NAD(P)-dependent oxidoreductase n=1 Tax=Streptomyces tubercidicus TaxID=47759 RepID=UPI003465365F